LIENEKKINADPELQHIVASIKVQAFVVGDVPLDEKGNPILYSSYRNEFLEKL